MHITIVAAMSRNRVIGVNNRLPWRLPEDLRRFKALTWGKTVIMGRKTFESIGRALPGRRNIVLSRRPDYQAPDCEVRASLQEALALARPDGEAIVMGGSAVFAEALPLCHTLHLTMVDADVEGDALFPELGPEGWPEGWEEGWEEEVEGVFPSTPERPYAYRFLTLRRRPALGEAP